MIYTITGEGLVPVDTEQFTTLERGDVIRWGGNMGYIEEYKVILESRPSDNGVNYRCINLQRVGCPEDEYLPHISVVESWHIRDPKDETLRHRQHYFITGIKMVEARILELLEMIPIAEAREKAKAEAKVKAIHDAGQLTQSEKSSLGTKEIARRIREQLKAEFKNAAFSVNMEQYSSGSSIHIYLMKAKSNPLRRFEDIPKELKEQWAEHFGSMAQLEKVQSEGYHQMRISDQYDADECMHTFITEEGYKLLKRAQDIAEYYNYNNSDSQIDYFDVNFYLSLYIGKYDEPFTVG